MSGQLYGVYGAGGCGRGIMPLLREQIARSDAGKNRLVFIDDDSGKSVVNGHPVMSYPAFLREPAESRYAVLAVADGIVRARLAAACVADGVRFMETRAGNVVTMDDVAVGEGAVLSPFVTLTSNIRIGRHFHANLYSSIEHDCVIGDFVTFAPGVRCNGNTIIEDFAYIGCGAVIRQGKPGDPLVIGRGAVVGMGAVVTKSLEPGSVVAGNPARPLSKP